jgi:deoxyribodipyrimidine photo-lyase
MTSAVPDVRLKPINQAALRPSGRFVVYWMTSARRLRWNYGLQRAVDYAVAWQQPLVILEALRCDYPHASDRLHQFVLDGMAANQRLAAGSRALYFPYVEPSHGHGSTLLATLAARASVVVTDWSPAFFLPHMLHAAGRTLDVRLEAVDSNGLIPLSAHGKAFTAARFYRAFVQRELREHVTALPEEAPLARLRGGPQLSSLPKDVARRWSPARPRIIAGGPSLAALPIDHDVAPAPISGGSAEAAKALKRFVADNLARYDDARNHPDEDATSRLSPYLHFGHISAHEIFAAVMTHERWTTRRLGKTGGGKREGWWGVSAGAGAFLDQLVVWRELAFNTSEYVANYTAYESLPDWARRTLAAHRRDRRPVIYALAQLEAAETDDEVWNAAQRQLVAEGWCHGYLRMLWGKKILEWSRHPADALATMALLMDRYALDGRDPNSYAGYSWVLGRYDRPWPERPVFGTVRYMSSASTRRKLRMRAFLDRFGDNG